MKKEDVMTSVELAAKGYALWENYKTKKIIIIAVSSNMDGFIYGLIDNVQPFEGQELVDLKHDLKILNWFENVEKVTFKVQEYPEE